MKINFCILIFYSVIISGCRTSKINFYSYSVNWYSVDTGKTLISSHNFISYDSILFEFIENSHNEIFTNKYSKQEVLLNRKDTMNIYLMSNDNKNFFEFNSFNLQSKLLRVESRSNKPFGINFKLPISSENFKYTAPKDTFINNIQLYYSNLITIDNEMNWNLILFKDPHFNSIYKVNGVFYPDSDFSIVGFYGNNRKINLGFIQEVTLLRKLTKKEKDICRSMIMKMTNSIRDSVRIH